MKYLRNVFITYLPLLAIYSIYILFRHNDAFIFDEDKYMRFASNLLEGYYSEPSPNIYIGVGPGYPILLMPFLWLNIPLVFLSLLNGVFHYLSVVFLHKTLIEFVSKTWCYILCIFWGLFPNAFEYIHLGLPESLPSFLIVLFLFFYTLSKQRKSSTTYTIFAGLIFGYLMLTKIIFGYVFLAMLLLYLVSIVFGLKKQSIKQYAIILSISFAVSLPYLIYTYQMTNQIFCWGTTGGNNLYWFSSPYEGEHGDWFAYHSLDIDSAAYKENPLLESKMKENHRTDHEKILALDGIEQDEMYKQIAINNMKSNPEKMVWNTIANVGRLFFNYPYSYRLQKPQTLFRMPFTGLLLILMIYSVFPICLNWRKTPSQFKLAFLISFLYLGGSTLGSAETRMLTVIVPAILLWVGYVIDKTLKIQATY